MSRWRDPELWEKWIRGDDCPICRSVANDQAVAELEVIRLMMSEDAPMRGYAWLPFRRHVIELYELDDAEAAAFMRDIRRATRAIAAATNPIKLNYEIHGNTVPHLHVHVFPRYVGDPFEGGPVNPRAIRGPVYGPGDFEALRARVLEHLSRAESHEAS